MDFSSFSSIELVPNFQARAAFSINSASVFREQTDIAPVIVDENTSFIPWGGDNNLPFDVLDLIERDETLTTCQLFNAEVCYGSGLVYNTAGATSKIRGAIDEFLLNNNLAQYFLGVCQDFKHFGWCVSVIILNAEGTQIVRILRKEVMYCRFAPADEQGIIKEILYYNWRCATEPDKIEHIALLDMNTPWADLQERIAKKTNIRKFAIVTKVPTADSTYYPIPHYASLFRGKWYNIKQLIGIAKEAKLKNAAPIKYHIEVAARYWTELFKQHGLTDKKEQQEFVEAEKQKIIDFLTGVENAGKAWFSTFYTDPNGREQHDVVINKVDDTKEGGDWESDIQEAVNMICFTMRVHSNLVGSVPGKAQTNNSGSDKRELYTIAQALQKPYHDLLFLPHQILIRFNKWANVTVDCPFIQLTTLDEHQDAKPVTPNQNESNK